MFLGILYAIYILNCFILIFFVLLQQSKGGGLAGAFGGGGGDTLFGYTSMQKIGHYTIYAAVLFMLLSLFIASFPHQKRSASVVPFEETAAGMPMGPGPAQPAGQPDAPSEGAGAPPAEAPVRAELPQ